MRDWLQGSADCMEQGTDFKRVVWCTPLGGVMMQATMLSHTGGLHNLTANKTELGEVGKGAATQMIYDGGFTACADQDWIGHQSTCRCKTHNRCKEFGQRSPTADILYFWPGSSKGIVEYKSRVGILDGST